MQKILLLSALFIATIFSCKKDEPKTLAEIVGRYAVAVEYQDAAVGFPNVVYYNDTLLVAEGITEDEIEVTSLNDIVTLRKQPTGNDQTLQYSADINGISFSAYFFNEKSIQFESIKHNASRKHSGEKL